MANVRWHSKAQRNMNSCARTLKGLNPGVGSDSARSIPHFQNESFASAFIADFEQAAWLCCNVLCMMLKGVTTSPCLPYDNACFPP